MMLRDSLLCPKGTLSFLLLAHSGPQPFEDALDLVPSTVCIYNMQFDKKVSQELASRRTQCVLTLGLTLQRLNNTQIFPLT